MTVEEIILKGVREECVKQYPGRTIGNCLFDSYNKIKWSFCIDDFVIRLDNDYIHIDNELFNVPVSNHRTHKHFWLCRTVTHSFEIADPEFPENMLQFLDQYLKTPDKQ